MSSEDHNCEFLGLNVRKYIIQKKAVILDLADMQAFLSTLIFSRKTGGYI